MEFKSKIILSATVLVGLVLALLFPAGNTLSSKRKEMLKSKQTLEMLGGLVLQYRKTHSGNNPEKISDILPEGAYYDLSMFKVKDAGMGLESDSAENRLVAIDQNSDFLLPKSKTSMFLVHERPGLWEDGSVAVCYVDLSVRRLTSREFSDLASANNSNHSRK